MKNINKNLLTTFIIVLMISVCCVVGKPAERDSDEDNKVVTEKVTTSVRSDHKLPYNSNPNQSHDIKDESGRSQLLDSIFNIPIATLKAVNDLVQNIAGNLQKAGSGSYFSRSEKIRVLPEPST